MLNGSTSKSVKSKTISNNYYYVFIIHESIKPYNHSFMEFDFYSNVEIEHCNLEYNHSDILQAF